MTIFAYDMNIADAVASQGHCRLCQQKETKNACQAMLNALMQNRKYL